MRAASGVQSDKPDNTHKAEKGRTSTMSVENGPRADAASPDHGFVVSVESRGDDRTPAVLLLAGELDSLAAAQLSDSLHVVDRRAPSLVLDMREVSFIDSSGLRTLIQARQMFPGDPAALTLRNPQPSTTRLLELTGLSDYFDVAT